MTPQRIQKLKQVAALRQPNLTVILENIIDLHNLGAVLRSCDSVGIKEIFVLQTEEKLRTTHLELGKRTSAGARRWIDVNYYHDVDSCFEHVRSHYDTVWSTHLDAEAKNLYELELTGSIALLFGNENLGLSEPALAQADGNFVIPQVGMVQSLNISVACAVTLYEAFRQRRAKGMYSDNLPMSPESQQALFEDYTQRSKKDVRGEFADLIR